MTGTIEANGNIQSLMNYSNNCTDACYSWLLCGCISLIKAPLLLAMDLAPSCYYALFRQCSNLSTVPQLPATGLADACYSAIYVNCTGLSTIPKNYLSASTLLTSRCYASMFYGCSNLTNAPYLSSTTVPPSCYSYMFYGCTSLTSAPVLPATTLTERCYQYMFYNCNKLSSIFVRFTDWKSNLSATTNWVNGIINNFGTFYKPDILPIESGISRIPTGWTTQTLEDFTPLTFTGKDETNAIALYANQYTTPSLNLQYSKNGGLWQTYTWTTQGSTNNSIGQIIELAQNETVAFSGNNTKVNDWHAQQVNGTGLYYKFQMTGTIEAAGNINSLINYSNNILYSWCYAYMFQNCTSLTTPPSLPATGLAQYCYYGMFSGCSSLTAAPYLPASSVDFWYCYAYMFQGCTKLSNINVAFTSWSDVVTYNWVDGVAPTGTFTKPSSLPLSTGINYIPSGWTVINKD